MLNQILTQLQRPDLPHNAQNSQHLPQIAWKTGTSYGRRDAWSIGYNKKHTVGVWVGNFSGEGVPELNGTDSATPLLFSIFTPFILEEWDKEISLSVGDEKGERDGSTLSNIQSPRHR